MDYSGLKNVELKDAYFKAIQDRGDISKERDVEVEKVKTLYNQNIEKIDNAIELINNEVNERIKSKTITLEEVDGIYGEMI